MVRDDIIDMSNDNDAPSKGCDTVQEVTGLDDIGDRSTTSSTSQCTDSAQEIAAYTHILRLLNNNKNEQCLCEDFLDILNCVMLHLVKSR